MKWPPGRPMRRISVSTGSTSSGSRCSSASNERHDIGDAAGKRHAVHRRDDVRVVVGEVDPEAIDAASAELRG